MSSKQEEHDEDDDPTLKLTDTLQHAGVCGCSKNAGNVAPSWLADHPPRPHFVFPIAGKKCNSDLSGTDGGGTESKTHSDLAC